MDDISEDKNVARDTVEGHEVCETKDVAWLCLNNIYNHFLRPNFYDIGGTCMNEMAGYWFLYKTEHVSNIYLLHLFVSNRWEGSFTLLLCHSNEMKINECTNTIYLDSACKVFNFENLKDSNYSYVTTYSFSEVDIELMKDKKLLISITINDTATKAIQIPLDNIKRLHDFGQLLSDSVCADFTMIAADGVKFPVHKVLLAQRSEVFKAMLKEDTAESINNFVKIDDVNKDDLSSIIEFIYTGTVKEIHDKNWLNLMMLGDRYDLKGLKELSQHVLRQNLNNNNALETLIAADMCNSTTLKISTFKYIKNNIATLGNSIFHEINNIALVQDLCKYLAMKY